MISFFSGLGLGLSLIIAIGTQNVFVLRQGIRREHVWGVVAICALSDAALIAAGVGGLGLLLQSAPWLVEAARWLGGAVLIGYGLLAARRAWQGGSESLHVEEAPQEAGDTGVNTLTQTSTRLMPVVLTVLALTWLNPHVYLDTVLLLGSIAATHGDLRWIFAAGAILASIIWFTALGYGARYLGRWLRTPQSWRVVDALIAVVMIALAINLVLPALLT